MATFARTTRTTAVPHLTVDERVARGKAARAEVPRSRHAEFEPPHDRADPVDLLEDQARTRVPELVPIRYGRMLVSPFTFYRGAAKIMAHDLAGTPRSGLTAQCCGDAHLSNFGVFASPERKLVFDINDFDETLPGPWEWDVKRLAASMLIAARDNGFAAKDQEQGRARHGREYRTAMREFAGMQNLEVWYAHLEIESVLQQFASQVKSRPDQADRGGPRQGAHPRQHVRVLEAHAAGQRNGRDRRSVAVDRAAPRAHARGCSKSSGWSSCAKLIRVYRVSLDHDRRKLLEQFQLADFARKVVGVGSVGTRAWIALFFGRDGSDPLFLQLKEAEESVLEEHVGKSQFKNHGQRVVVGQRLMQATSDIFLGWIHVKEGMDGVARDFYGRQLKDWKGSAEIEQMVPSGMAAYGRALRLDARASACPERRSHRDRVLPRRRQRVRSRDPRLLQGLRGPERRRLRRARRGGQVGPDRRSDRTLSGDQLHFDFVALWKLLTAVTTAETWLGI